jgi:phosphoribosylglycinamide formyltransferase-1
VLRVGVLASGEGTNFQALHDACVSGYAGAEIVVVLCNRRESGVLRRAAHAGVEGVFVDPRDAPSRESYDRMLLAHLKMYGVDLVCAAGYMRLLSPEFVGAYANRILNVHPSLLPAFPGLEAVEAAWSWGVRVTGATVHIIDTELDHGPILYQRAVDVRPDDTLEKLTERVHLAEYAVYPKALRFWASTTNVRLDGRRVVVDTEHPDPPWSPGPPPSLRGGT